MYIKNRPFSLLYKLLLAVLSIIALWGSFFARGISAWRLFSTYILILSAGYFLITALLLTFRPQKPLSTRSAPTIQGAIIVSLTLCGIVVTSYRASGITLPALPDFHGFLIYGLLPIMVFLDWLIFSDKGQWRMIDPWYWLAPSVIYAAAILFSAEISSGNIFPDGLRYPLHFLDIATNGLPALLTCLLFICVMTLLFGYFLVVLDFVLSGQLPKYVVLPHIRTVEVEVDDTAEPSVRSKIATKISSLSKSKISQQAKTESTAKSSVKSTIDVSKATKPIKTSTIKNRKPKSAKSKPRL